ncbi:MAG: hypothetical protein HQK55_09130 [Deltaproteobacteria bacterium]|nr:hypothetical protein [Deltaproteobacteria bacterium]
MNIIDLIQDKRFLGQEFLTWLWVTSEINSGLVEAEGLGQVEVRFVQRLVLDAGTGNTRRVVTCQGQDLDLAEARTALREGKKVYQAKLRLKADSREWLVNVKAEGFELTGIRGPKTFDPGEEEAESLAGRLLDRIAVTLELTRIFDGLYARFMAVRLTDAWNNAELPSLRRWLMED